MFEDAVTEKRFKQKVREKTRKKNKIITRPRLNVLKKSRKRKSNQSQFIDELEMIWKNKKDLKKKS